MLQCYVTDFQPLDQESPFLTFAERLLGSRLFHGHKKCFIVQSAPTPGAEREAGLKEEEDQ